MSSFHRGDMCFILIQADQFCLLLTSRVQTVCCSKWLIFASTPDCGQTTKLMMTIDDKTIDFVD